MKKRLLAVWLSLLFLLTAGCKKNVTVDYPADEKFNLDNVSDVSDTKTPDSIKYDVYNKKGELTYVVEAEVMGSTNDEYPVYQILRNDIDNDDIKRIVNDLFDEGTVTVLSPYRYSDKEYADKRKAMLEERKKDYEKRNIPVPAYIREETDTISDEDFDDKIRVGIQSDPEYLYMSFHNKEGMKAVFGICIVEGKIGDDYYRAEFFKTNTMTSMYVFLLDQKFQESNSVTEMVGGRYKGIEYDGEFGEIFDSNRKSAQIYFDALGLNGYEYIAEMPTLVENVYHAIPGTVANGVEVFYAPNVSQRTRLFSSDYEQYHALGEGEEVFSEKSIYKMLYYEGYEPDAYSTNPEEVTSLEESDYFGTGNPWAFESISINTSGDRLINMTWICPTDVGEIQSESAQMLDFETIDELAKEYLAENESERGVTTISKVILGMAQYKSDSGEYYMVPAWYYMDEGDSSWSTLNLDVAVNAIDGSILAKGYWIQLKELLQ